MLCILWHNRMIQECIDSESDPFESFYGVYDPDECSDSSDHDHDNDGNIEGTSG